MAAKHDCDFRPGDIVLADGGVGVEDNAEREFWVCGEWDRAGDEVTEAVDGGARGWSRRG